MGWGCVVGCFLPFPLWFAFLGQVYGFLVVVFECRQRLFLFLWWPFRVGFVSVLCRVMHVSWYFFKRLGFSVWRGFCGSNDVPRD